MKGAGGILKEVLLVCSHHHLVHKRWYYIQGHKLHYWLLMDNVRRGNPERRMVLHVEGAGVVGPGSRLRLTHKRECCTRGHTPHFYEQRGSDWHRIQGHS